jgi:hypothetical protein
LKQNLVSAPKFPAHSFPGDIFPALSAAFPELSRQQQANQQRQEGGNTLNRTIAQRIDNTTPHDHYA